MVFFFVLLLLCYANALVENLVFYQRSRGIEIQWNLGVIDNEVNY